MYMVLRHVPPKKRVRLPCYRSYNHNKDIQTICMHLHIWYMYLSTIRIIVFFPAWKKTNVIPYFTVDGMEVKKVIESNVYINQVKPWPLTILTYKVLQQSKMKQYNYKHEVRSRKVWRNTLSLCLLSLSQKLKAPSEPAVAKVWCNWNKSPSNNQTTDNINNTQSWQLINDILSIYLKVDSKDLKHGPISTQDNMPHEINYS